MTAFPILFPSWASTLSGFREWATSDEFPDHLRAAFLDGVLFLEMSNEEPETHVKVKGEIYRELATFFLESDPGEFYVDGILISNEEANLSSNPDASFISYESFEEGKVVRIPRQTRDDRFAEFSGAVDWVLEVVSDSSVQKDTVRLMELYHRAGVAEYWLVDARGDEIQFTIYYWRKRGYVAAPVKDSWHKSRVFGREFRLTRSRSRGGFYRYRLESR